MKRKAVILLSGGLDSTTCAAIARKKQFELYGLTINYGQKHIFEIESAKSVADYFNMKKHIVIDIDLASFGGSSLTSKNLEVPKNRILSNNDIPTTYVPARNTVFFISPLRACLLHLFLNATATALFALFCPTTNLSSSETISLGDKELTKDISSF